MTDHPRDPGNNPGGNPLGNTSYPRHRVAPAKRRQRIRGCGVPATVWFAPHPETPILTALQNDAHQRDPGPWALAEIIRQFTAPGQKYTIARVAHPTDGVETVVTAHRREPAPESSSDVNAETSDTSGFDTLVAVIPEEPYNGQECKRARDVIQEAFTARLAQYIEFAHGTLRDGGILAVQIPRPAPGPGFHDETGNTVNAAREKGFAYLQHIALVDSHIAHDEGIIPVLPQEDLDAFWTARAQGFRVHARSHSDLLVFHKLAKADILD
jgi:hypothetical protein